MSCNTIKKKNLNEIAEEIINSLKKVSDPFVSPVIVVHNKKIEQWFKAYYLKSHSEVLMNVTFMTLSVFVNGIVNPEKKYTIVDKPVLKKYILKVLLDPSKYSYDAKNPKAETNFIFDKGGSMNGIKLLEFADRLSGLFMEYETDMAEITGWQKEVYESALELAENDGCCTTKRLFDECFDATLKSGSPNAPVYIIDNSYITNLFKSILNACPDADITVYSLEDSQTAASADTAIIAAPSRLREVEAVHSEICKIISSDTTTRFNDIVIYAPNIAEYANTIRRVFLQDDTAFPSLPFCIVGEYREKQDIVNVLQLLFDIANKRFFTRNDFYKFIKNPLIKWVKDISDEEIELWMDVIINTNTHRNSETEDDWAYIRRRLLISVLVSNEAGHDACTDVSGTSTLPYSTKGLDNAQVNKLLNTVDLLSDWLSLFSDDLNKMTFDSAKMQSVLDKLNAIFSLPGSDGEETDYLYTDVRREMEELISLNAEMPANTVLLMLADAPNRYNITPVGMFFNGITCLSFNSDDIVSSKYAFVMGMSSENFPRPDLDNELDMSKKHMTNKDLDRMSVRNLCSNTEKVMFSYIKYNLQTEEEYYKSPLIPNVSGKEIEIGIDETRDYSELFTKKEFKNKEYIENIGNTNSAAAPKAPIDPVDDSGTAVISISDLKHYLENSFIYKYKKIVRIEDDNDSDILEEYEQIDAGKLKSYNVLQESFKGNADNDVKEIEKMKKDLPPREIGDAYLDRYLEIASDIKSIIADYDPIKKEDVEISYCDPGGNTKKLTIRNNLDLVKKEEGSDLYFYDPVYFYVSDKYAQHYLNMYFESLVDVASRKDDKEYTIHMGTAPKEKTFTITAKEASSLLDEISSDMSNLNDLSYMDIDYVTSCAEDANNIMQDKIPASLNALIGEIDKHSKWTRFSDKNLPDAYTSFGYTEAGFNKEFTDKLLKVRNYIRFDISKSKKKGV